MKGLLKYEYPLHYVKTFIYFYAVVDPEVDEEAELSGVEVVELLEAKSPGRLGFVGVALELTTLVPSNEAASAENSEF